MGRQPGSPERPAQTAKPTGESAADKAARKREEAAIRNEFSRPRKALEAKIEAAETRSAKLEAEQAAIYDDMAAAKPGTDFQTLNKRLAEIKKELEDAAWAWEDASVRLENLIADMEQRIGALNK